ncbi:MAG: hypothetical protein RL071_2613 [Pseudomonadota bacterium]|jgi:hypothetical protein
MAPSSPDGLWVTAARIEELLDDDMSLQTLKNQYSPEELLALLEAPAAIQSDDALYTALMDVMYATRPQGVI